MVGRASPRWSRFALAIAESTPGAPLCLSLCNTRHWRNSAAPREVLASYDEVVKWSIAKAIYTESEGAALVREAHAHPHVANAELRRVVILREALARVFAAHAHGRTADSDALAAIDTDFREALANLALHVRDGCLVPSLPPTGEGLEVPRWQAALSAASLLASPALARVKQCADDRGCGWLFCDTTRNGSRQYCFSRECGNRARQARFRARRREHAQAGH